MIIHNILAVNSRLSILRMYLKVLEIVKKNTQYSFLAIIQKASYNKYITELLELATKQNAQTID